MYQYRHTVTGTVIHTGNPIFGGKWELTEAPTTAKAKENKPVTKEDDVEIIDEAKTTKKAAKKKG